MTHSADLKDRTMGFAAPLLASEVKAVFQNDTNVAKPNAIIASGDMAFITGFVKAITSVCKENPDTPLVLCGGINARYNLLSAAKETATVGYLFWKATGLSPRTVCQKNECDILKDILTDPSHKYAKARAKLGIEPLSPDHKILTAAGSHFGENMKLAYDELELAGISTNRLMVVGSYHSSRLYRYAQRAFPKAKIGYKAYIWHLGDTRLVPSEVMHKKHSLYNKLARTFARGEMSRLERYALLDGIELGNISTARESASRPSRRQREDR